MKENNRIGPVLWLNLNLLSTSTNYMLYLEAVPERNAVTFYGFDIHLLDKQWEFLFDVFFCVGLFEVNTWKLDTRVAS